jgi:hypothetical protein
MLAEIFMLRLEAATRKSDGTIPSSSSPFVRIFADTNFTFKETRQKTPTHISRDEKRKMSE